MPSGTQIHAAPSGKHLQSPFRSSGAQICAAGHVPPQVGDSLAAQSGIVDVDVELVVDVVVVVLVVVGGGGFTSEGTQSSRRWLTRSCCAPNWLCRKTETVAR